MWIIHFGCEWKSHDRPSLLSISCQRLPRQSCRLIKAGVLAKRLSPQVSRMSAAAELVGYAGSLAFSAFQLLLLRHQEASLQRRLFRLPQVAARLLLSCATSVMLCRQAAYVLDHL